METAVEIGIQVNGRTRGTMVVNPDEPAIGWQAQEIPEVAKAIAGRKVKKVVYIPERIVNIVCE